MSNATGTKPRSRPVLRWVLRGVVVALLIAACASGYAWWRWRSQPAYWHKAQAFLEGAEQNPHVRTMAQSVEARVTSSTNEPGTGRLPVRRVVAASTQALLTEATTAAIEGADDAARSGVYPDGTHWLAMGVQEANAWLTLRLPKLLANQNAAMPQGVGTPIVAVEEGRIVVATRVAQVNQVVSVVLDARMTEQDQLFLKVHEVRGGRLVLPVNMLIKTLKENQQALGAPPDMIRWVHQAMEGMTLEPEGRIADRDVRLKDIKISDDYVEVDFVTKYTHSE